MPLKNTVISNLFGGVSQQPAGIRMDNQAEEVINAYPSLTDGLVKRPPTEFIAAIGDSAPTTISFSAGDYVDLHDSAGLFLVRPETATLQDGDTIAVSGFTELLLNRNYTVTSAVSAEWIEVYPVDWPGGMIPSEDAGNPITIELVT